MKERVILIIVIIFNIVILYIQKDVEFTAGWSSYIKTMCWSLNTLWTYEKTREWNYYISCRSDPRRYLLDSEWEIIKTL